MGNEPSLSISELFYSIQGESTFAGLPCVFIRTAGCNLRCSYCDAAYTYEETGREMPLAEILHYVERYPQALVEITGGEPLLQQNVSSLMASLVARKRTVLLETNGSQALDSVPIEVHAIVDIKCPGSGMESSWLAANLQEVRNRAAARPNSTEIKFVLRDMQDYQFARSFVLEQALYEVAPVLFSPVRDTLPLLLLAQAILDDELPVRLQLQLHTVIWPTVARGV